MSQMLITDFVCFSWLKDGQPVPGGGGGDLRLAAVGRADRGWYRCVAANMAGIRETDPVLLSVIGKRFEAGSRDVIYYVMNSTVGAKRKVALGKIFDVAKRGCLVGR